MYIWNVALAEQLKHGRRREISPDEREAHVSALKGLVGALHDQLVSHKIDRDAGSGFPEECHNFDAFLRGGGGEMIRITSVGKTNQPSGTGLFLYVFMSGKGEVVGLQTAKLPDSVDEHASDWLSGYNAAQFKLMETLVAGASAISKDEFEKATKEACGY